MENDMQLTFGLEMEVKVAVRMARMRDFLASLPETSHLELLKADADIIRLRATRGPYNHKKYLSAVIHDPNVSTDPAASGYPEETQLVYLNDRNKTPISKYRSYGDEHLKMLQEVIRPIQDATVWGDLNTRRTDFRPDGPWTIMGDTSLAALEPNEISRIFPELFRADPPTEAEAMSEIDSFGAEIITPPFTCANFDAAESTLQKLCTHLNSQAHSGHEVGVTTDRETGLHVHVGQASNKPFPLKARQHLALLCLIYEDEISRLHPPDRRDGNPEILPNRTEFRIEGADPITRPTTGTKRWFATYHAIPSTRRQIVDAVDAAPSPEAKFLQTMGPKQRFVNFSISGRNTERGDGAATIEFRQHAGTVSAADITHWARHCVALVRLALRCSDGEPAALALCDVDDWDDERVSLERLWDVMGLEPATREFLKQRREEYDARWSDWQPEPLYTEDIWGSDDGLDGDPLPELTNEQDLNEAEDTAPSEPNADEDDRIDAVERSPPATQQQDNGSDDATPPARTTHKRQASENTAQPRRLVRIEYGSDDDDDAEERARRPRWKRYLCHCFGVCTCLL